MPQMRAGVGVRERGQTAPHRFSPYSAIKRFEQ